MKQQFQHLFFFGFLLCHIQVLSNNIQVDNVQITDQNPNEGYAMVQFDLSWENSWRLDQGPSNWDAAWVFLKIRANGGNWKHGTLNYVNGDAITDGHIPPSGVIINTSSDQVGCFIYRADTGSGDNDWKGIQLRWNYGIDTVLVNDVLEIEIMAIEMVYIPEGSFTVGGGLGSEVGKIYSPQGLLQAQGYQVNSEGIIPVAPSGNTLFYPSPAGENAGDQSGPIPAAFPKGYAAFYCMKYEVSQYMWITFFNMLTDTQKLNHDITDQDHRGSNEIDRNSIEWFTGGATTEDPFIPITFVFWNDVMAFMDWSGLRPMSELEYVKACRGPLSPVSNGYAWGTSNIIGTDHTYDLQNTRSANELLVNHISHTGNANTIFASIFEDGPMRCGIFAASAKKPRREDTGATFYGIMEMSGNVSEMAVTIGNPEGRAFTGLHGDGKLTIAGASDVTNWPLPTGEGGGLFGGSWFSLLECLTINDRRDATVGNTGYFNDVGFRCVRTAE